jgi:hypothetical protein
MANTKATIRFHNKTFPLTTVRGEHIAKPVPDLLPGLRVAWRKINKNTYDEVKVYQFVSRNKVDLLGYKRIHKSEKFSPHDFARTVYNTYLQYSNIN